MRLIEKDAKQLLHQIGVSIPEGFFIDWSMKEWPPEKAWNGPYYLKAQVLQGRRGKGGLVQKCSSPDEFHRILSELHERLSLDICDGFWCEKEQTHTEEWFVSCDIDYETRTIRGHVSREGGKEVALVETFSATDLDDSQKTTHLPKPIISLLHILIESLPKLDALSIEINPCIVDTGDNAIALDGKIELDDAASFRHPEWDHFSDLSRFGNTSSSRERAYLDLLLKHNRPLLGSYVELSGNIAMILAGGGASLVAMDALKQAGGNAANYLELSGNPDPDFLREAAKIVFSHPDIQAIWIAGSFANFTNIEATVAAILQAAEETGIHVPIFIRRDGPGADAAQHAAMEWAKRYGVALVFHRGEVDLSESAKELVETLSL